MMLLRMLTKQTVVSADRCSSARSRMLFQWLACAVGMPGGMGTPRGWAESSGRERPHSERAINCTFGYPANVAQTVIPYGKGFRTPNRCQVGGHINLCNRVRGMTIHYECLRRWQMPAGF
jgi:hypothetical protein